MGAAIAGYGGNVKISSAVVANVKQWELPLASDMYDVSVLGSQWKSYLPGLLGSDAKLDVFFDATDTTGQIAMQNALLAGTSVSLVLTTSNAQGAAAHTYTGTAFVKGLDIKDPVGAPEEATLTLVFSGAITYA